MKMKILTLVRHAKSSWKDTELVDFDRPLNKRGKDDAPKMGQRLKKYQISPDLIITSPANRALTTAKVIAREIDYPAKELIADKQVYLANTYGVLEVVKKVKSIYQDVFLVGHNPTLTELANDLTGEVIENIPTCGLVRMKFDIDEWEDLGKNKGNLLLFDYPKMHH